MVEVGGDIAPLSSHTCLSPDDEVVQVGDVILTPVPSGDILGQSPFRYRLPVPLEIG